MNAAELHMPSQATLRRGAAAGFATAAALAVTVTMLFPQRADAVPFLSTLLNGLLGLSVEAVLCVLLLAPVLALLDCMVSPLVSVMFQWGTDYLSIPVVNKVILSLQALALVAVLVVRVAAGIQNGILGEGIGSKQQSVGEYLFRTFAAVIMVAIMPTLCRAVILAGRSVYNGITDNLGITIADQIEFFDITSCKWYDLVDYFINHCSSGFLGTAISFTVGLLLFYVLAAVCGYQFVKRQIDMLVVSMIAPLVSIKYAQEDASSRSEVYSLLQKLFGLCCMQWIQYLLVEIAVAFGRQWIVVVINGGFGEAFSTETISGTGGWTGASLFVWCIAFYIAALTLPKLLDQFTFADSGGDLRMIMMVGGRMNPAGAAKQGWDNAKNRGGTISSAVKSMTSKKVK